MYKNKRIVTELAVAQVCTSARARPIRAVRGDTQTAAAGAREATLPKPTLWATQNNPQHPRRPHVHAALAVGSCHTPQRAPEEQLIGALARASQPPARPADWRGWRVGIAPGAGLLGGSVASVTVESQGYLQADRANAEPVTDIRSLVRARMLSRGGWAGLRWRAWS